jgi:hypothetical protein
MLAALACLLAPAPTAKALVLDWDGVTWNPGSLNSSFDLNADAINDITVSMTSQQANIWTNDPVTGDQTPAITQTMTGGLSPVQNSLILAANLKTQSNLTVHISFTGAQAGANNVSFSIFDIDVTTNSDIIDTIYGVALDGTHIAATITNVGSSVNHTGTGLNQVLTGNSATANNSSNGNATLTFGSTIITDIFFTFSNTSGAPRYQDIGIGDITFSPVPEINPTAVAAICCLSGLGFVFLARRRARQTAVLVTSELPPPR